MMLLKPGERLGRVSSWGAKSSWKKVIRFGVGFLAILAFAVILWPKPERHDATVNIAPNVTVSADIKCPLDLELIERFGVHKLRNYLRREVVAVESDADLPRSQSHEAPFLDTGKLSDADKDLIKQSQDECLNPLPITLNVPRSPKTVDASHIDFGVATTLERLNNSLDAFSHWAGYTRTRIFALLEPHEKVPEVEAKADLLGINLHVTQSSEEYQTRYFLLIKHLAENMREQTRWSCIIDDDTFFLSMQALVNALAEYDDTQPVYLGGLSESIPQVGIFGMMAFGGAGVFLSRPLLTELSDSKVLRDCQMMDYTGDRRISYCVYQHTNTKLTVDHRLRQLDMRGDVSGFFESGREPPLSVHHWKSWFDTDMTKVSAVSELCGDTCLLRKWFFSDGWILTNGFSIVKYSSKIEIDDPSMELTWFGDHGAEFESYLHELGPLRDKDWGKLSFTLEDASVEDDTVHQYYVHRDEQKGDEIIELIWRSG